MAGLDKAANRAAVPTVPEIWAGAWDNRANRPWGGGVEDSLWMLVVGFGAGGGEEWSGEGVSGCGGGCGPMQRPYPGSNPNPANKNTKNFPGPVRGCNCDRYTGFCCSKFAITVQEL